MLSLEQSLHFCAHHRTAQQRPLQEAGGSGDGDPASHAVSGAGDLRGAPPTPPSHPRAPGAVPGCLCAKQRFVAGFINRNMTARAGPPPVLPPRRAAGPVGVLRPGGSQSQAATRDHPRGARKWIRGSAAAEPHPARHTQRVPTRLRPGVRDRTVETQVGLGAPRPAAGKHRPCPLAIGFSVSVTRNFPFP